MISFIVEMFFIRKNTTEVSYFQDVSTNFLLLKINQLKLFALYFLEN